MNPVARPGLGEPAQAEACWRRILGLRPPEEFGSVDMGIYGRVAQRNLAVLAAERGDHAEAERLWAEVLVECPGDREALCALERGRAALRVPVQQQPRPPGPQAVRAAGPPLRDREPCPKDLAAAAVGPQPGEDSSAG